MKISLFQGILFGVFGIAALVGLFVFATHQGRTTTNVVGTVSIWGTLPKASMDSIFSTLAQTNPLLKDVTYTEKNPSTLASELATAIATGGAPDLVLSSQEQLLSLAKFITPIPYATISASTFVNTFADAGQVFTAPGGQGYYGVPFLIDPLVLFYNKSILSSSGIAKPPATWEALIGLVPNVAVQTPSRQITRGLIALGTYDNVKNARGILSALLLQQGVPIVSYATDGSLTANLGQTSSSGVPPGRSVLGFYTQFADPSKVSYTWNASLPNSDQAFLAGDLALYLGYVSEARFLSSANPNLNFAVATLPQPGTAKFKSAYGHVYAFMLPRGARNSAGGYQVAALLSNANEQVVASLTTGLAPVSLTELAKQSTDPIGSVAYAEALYTRGWLSPAPSDTDTVFSGMIGNVISGRSTLEVALGSAERALSALLQK